MERSYKVSVSELKKSKIIGCTNGDDHRLLSVVQLQLESGKVLYIIGSIGSMMLVRDVNGNIYDVIDDSADTAEGVN